MTPDKRYIIFYTCIPLPICSPLSCLWFWISAMFNHRNRIFYLWLLGALATEADHVIHVMALAPSPLLLLLSLVLPIDHSVIVRISAEDFAAFKGKQGRKNDQSRSWPLMQVPSYASTEVGDLTWLKIPLPWAPGPPPSPSPNNVISWQAIFLLLWAVTRNTAPIFLLQPCASFVVSCEASLRPTAWKEERNEAKSLIFPTPLSRPASGFFTLFGRASRLLLRLLCYFPI